MCPVSEKKPLADADTVAQPLDDKTPDQPVTAADATINDQPNSSAQGTSGQSESGSEAPKRKVHPNRAAYELLHETYPDLFDIKAPKPLKIGIHVSLAEDGKLSKTKIRRALNYYVQQLSYIRAVAAGGKRHDLNGEAGDVSAEDAEHAQARVKDIEAKRKARRAEQRKQQQPRKPRAGKAGAPDKPEDRQSRRKTGGKPAGKPAKTEARQEQDVHAGASQEERISKKLESLAERFNKG